MKEERKGTQIVGWMQTEDGGQKDEQGQKKKGKDAGAGQLREEGDMEEVDGELKAAYTCKRGRGYKQ